METEELVIQEFTIHGKFRNWVDWLIVKSSRLHAEELLKHLQGSFKTREMRLIRRKYLLKEESLSSYINEE